MQKSIAQLLREQEKNLTIDFGDPGADSIMDFLYISYSEISGSDPEDITQGLLPPIGTSDGDIFKYHCPNFLCNGLV